MTSWEQSKDWYDRIVGEKGHYYHQSVILPRLIASLGKPPFKLLDLACGQGVLARALPPGANYVGIDLSPSLIKAAKSYSKAPFYVADATKPLPVKEKDFTHAAIVLALQNIADPLAVFKNAHTHLKQNGKLIIILNHPCFRIPRQSSWGIDADKKLQYRRIDRYLSPLKIPIQIDKAETWSFHNPLSSYTTWLKQAGFLIENIEEWCSDKKSTGPAAKMENRSREEFPLFMALTAIKFS